MPVSRRRSTRAWPAPATHWSCCLMVTRCSSPTRCGSCCSPSPTPLWAPSPV